jgi:sugar-specific transcriptional regulator TrmB
MKVIWLRKGMEEQQWKDGAEEQRLSSEKAAGKIEEEIDKIKKEINKIESYYRRTLKGGDAIENLKQVIGQIEKLVPLGQRNEQLKSLIVSLGRAIGNLFYVPLPPQ